MYAPAMRRVLGCLAAWSLTVAAAACAPEPARVGLNLRLTSGLLDSATTVELFVSTDGACNPATGQVKDVTEVEFFPLDRCGTSSWCKTISLDQDDQPRIFHVVAKNAGKEVAQGCTQAAIDRDPLDVAIKVKRFLEPGCCNDGKVQSTEQCDSGIVAPTDCAGNTPAQPQCNSIVTDEICECDCRAREIVLSTPGMNPTTSNDPNTKSGLSLAFSGASGSAEVAGSLRAVYADAQGFGGSVDVNLRTLKSNLTSITSGALAKQLRIPATCSNVQTAGIARDQKSPSIARVSASVSAVVFSDNKIQPQQFNVSLTALGGEGCADKEPLIVNANTSTSCDAPDVAGGPDGSALVVWNQGGQLRARVWKTDGTLAPASADIEIAAMAPGGKPHVAGSSKGWSVVYPSGDDVFVQSLDASGGLTGSARRVNIVTDGVQDQPDVAMLSDGTSIVVWQSGAGIFFQRYDANGKELAGDQTEPLSSLDPGAGATPVVAGNGDWYAIAWLTGGNSVWARFVSKAAGFGYNHVDGQNGAFLASHPIVDHPRTGPAIAIGDQFVAIGWQDTSTEEPVHGIVVRRFPLPE